MILRDATAAAIHQVMIQKHTEIYLIDWIQSRWQVEQLGELLWTQHLLDDSRGHCRTFKHTRLRVRSIMHEILICVGAS